MTSAGGAGVLCVVPARSGSRRLIDKNLAVLGGRTLLERAVATALEAFEDVVVSTDSERYASIARACGASVPGLRPAALATDDAGIDDVLRHLLSTIDSDARTLVIVQATTPFTTAADLLGVVEALDSNPDARCALTAAGVPPTYASLLVNRGGRSFSFADPTLAAMRTQDVPLIAVPTGGAYAARVERLRRGEPLLAGPFAVVEVEADRALDIDDADDLARARTLVAGSV